MKTRQILNILFWIFLIIGIIMIIWRIFGNSPTDLMIITPFILMSIIKTWSVSDELKEFKYEVKSSFTKIKIDMDNLKIKK